MTHHMELIIIFGCSCSATDAAAVPPPLPLQPPIHPWNRPIMGSPIQPIMMMMPLFQPLTIPTSRPPLPLPQPPPSTSYRRPFLWVRLANGLTGWLALMSIKIIMCSCCRTAKLLLLLLSLLLLKFGISYSFPYA